MMAGDSEYIWEMDTNESWTENTTMAVTEAESEKSKDAGSKEVTSDAKEKKPVEAAVRRTKKGHMILEIKRTFEVRASQEKEISAEETQDKAEKNEPDEETEKKKEEAVLAKAVKSQEELRKSAALRFKKKGPAWGQVASGDAKKEVASPIRDELKQ